MLQEEHAEMVAQGVRLVEWRLDYIRRSVELNRLLADRPGPAIATCRRPNEGGKWRGTERDRVMLLRTAVASGADYVDLEIDIAGQIPRYGKTKRIVSYHNFRETPANLEAIHDEASRYDPDIIKIVTLANSPDDNLRVLRLCRRNKIPTVAFCMGEIGTPSRILCAKFGAPFSYATVSDERALAPGQIGFERMKNLYRYESINDQTDVFGVVADPVSHSLSPLVHNMALKTIGANAVYLPFRVPREHFRDFIAAADEYGIKGLSVTIPHKEDVIRMATRQTDEVKGIGAANTLILRGGERRVANTDCAAAMKCIANVFYADVDAPDAFAKKRALILGTGGVARAMAFGLVKRGAEVYISGRNAEKTEYLAKDMGAKPIDWIAKHSCKPDLIINGTSVGMHPDVNDSPLEKQFFQSNMVIFDTVYNPEQTLFIKYAKEAGCRIITGIEMFVRQAAMQFELFTGQKASKREMRDQIKRAISAVRNTTPTEQPAEGEEGTEAEAEAKE